MAVQVFKDPYLFDFLGTDAPRREKELEQGLINHIQSFLLELGQGFAFVGRQVHLELDNCDYYIDAVIKFLKIYDGNTATFESYRRELERLLQWSWLIAKNLF